MNCFATSLVDSKMKLTFLIVILHSTTVLTTSVNQTSIDSAIPVGISLGNKLYAGESMVTNSYLVSSNQMYKGIMQSDGNFVIHSQIGNEEFSTKTSGQPEANLHFQLDGHVCLYSKVNSSSALWCSDGYFKSNMCQRCSCTLLLENDGSLSVYKGNIDPANKYWSSRLRPTSEDFEKIAKREDQDTCPFKSLQHMLSNKFGSPISLGDKLYAGQKMTNNSCLLSSNQKYVAIMQDDGNFAIYSKRGQVKFSTNTTGHNSVYLQFQTNGYVCLYQSEGEDLRLWCSNNYFSVNCQECGCILVLENDGSLSAYKGSIDPANKYWASRSRPSLKNFLKITDHNNPKNCPRDLDSKFNQKLSTYNAVGDKLYAGQVLSNNLLSSNNMYSGVMEVDGNFVIYSNTGKVEFSTNTTGQTGAHFSFQMDGRVCLGSTRNGEPAWCSDYFKINMCQRCSCTLVLENDGSLSAYKGNIEPPNKYWSSRSPPTLDEFKRITERDNVKTCPSGVDHILNDNLGIFTAIGDKLYSGQLMDSNSYLVSSNKMYIGIMQSDGNFVIYFKRGQEVFSTKSNGQSDVSLHFHLDGQICLENKVNNSSDLWCSDYLKSNMCQRCLCTLLLENDGSLSAYKGIIKPANKYWSSRSRPPLNEFNNIAQREDQDTCSIGFDQIVNGKFGNFTAIGGKLSAGQIMATNSYLISSNNMYLAIMQMDGNFVIYSSNGKVEFSTRTNGPTDVNLSFQLDGHICLGSKANDSVLWCSHGYFSENMCQRCPCTLLLENDGSLSAYKGAIDPANKYWASKSRPTLENFKKIAKRESIEICVMGFEHLINNKFGYFRAKGNQIGANVDLNNGDYLLSSNKMFVGIMQNDGNFVIYSKSGKVEFSTNTTGQTGLIFVFQLDGHVCLKNERSRESAWCSGYFKSKMCHRCQCTLVLEDDGSLSAYRGNIDPANKYWASKSTPSYDDFLKIAENQCPPTCSRTDKPLGKLNLDWLLETRPLDHEFSWRKNKFTLHAEENANWDTTFGQFLMSTSELERHTSKDSNQTIFYKQMSPSRGLFIAEYVASVINPDDIVTRESSTEATQTYTNKLVERAGIPKSSNRSSFNAGRVLGAQFGNICSFTVLNRHFII